MFVVVVVGAPERRSGGGGGIEKDRLSSRREPEGAELRGRDSARGR